MVRACYERANRAIELGTRRSTLAGDLYAAYAAGNQAAATTTQASINDEATEFDGVWKTFINTCGLPRKLYG